VVATTVNIRHTRTLGPSPWSLLGVWSGARAWLPGTARVRHGGNCASMLWLRTVPLPLPLLLLLLLLLVVVVPGE